MLKFFELFSAQGITSTAVSLLNKQATSMTTAILVALAMSLQVIFLLIAQCTVLKHIQPGNVTLIVRDMRVLTSLIESKKNETDSLRTNTLHLA